MNFSALSDRSPPLPLGLLWLLAGIYLLAGIVGHDPWKTEDAIHIGIAHGFVLSGDWSFPRIAGEPWPHTPPLFHWVAATLGRLLHGLLEFHDAARLATPLFGTLYLVALAGAARAFYGESAARLAPLLALGTLGLLTPIHDAQPAIAGLAFAAVAWWGGGMLLRGQARGLLLLGAGLGLGFLAHGLVGVLMGIAVLPAPTFRRAWPSLLLATALAVVIAAIWPLILAHQSPELWTLWWKNEFAEATFARSLPDARHAELLAWATWPVLPLAGWALWIRRQDPGMLLLPLLGASLALGWFLSGPDRTLSALVTLIPLTLLAAAGADRLRRGAASAFGWFGLTTFSFAAILIWLGASAQALDWPPRIAHNFEKLAPGHEVRYALPMLVFAMAISLLWLLAWRLKRTPWRASLQWASGVTLLWALIATLWLSWIDHAKSYRSATRALQAALPEQIDCIERSGLGPAQRASLDYFGGIRTTALTPGQRCNLRLTVADSDRVTPSGWTEIWRGGRPSDRKERWILERRAD
jgi:4-amino-4-deoxy-L-arabinose transferase-like glycosyltransferase